MNNDNLQRLIMNHIPLRNTDIASVAYDQSLETLEVIFMNGSLYQYPRVPEELFQNFLDAKNHDSYYETHVDGWEEPLVSTVI